MNFGKGQLRLIQEYAHEHPDDFALTLNNGSPDEAWRVLELLSREEQLRAVNRVSQRHASHMLELFGNEVVTQWLAMAPVGEARRLFSRLDRDRRAELLQDISHRSRRRALQGLVDIGLDSLGALADPDFQWVRASWTVADLAGSLLTTRSESQGAPVLVLDDEDRLTGVLDAVACLQGHPTTELRDCTIQVRELAAGAATRDAFGAPGWKHSLWLPIVDRNQRPVGVLSRERMLSAAENAPQKSEHLENPIVMLATDMFRVFLEIAKSLMSFKAG